MTTVNWQELINNAGGGSFEPLPIGDYDVVVAEANVATSSNGKLMFKTKLQVIAGPYASRLIFNQFVVSPESPGALGFFFQHMAVLGLDASFFASNPAPEQVAAALLNRPCKVTIKHGTYQGQPSMDVDKVLPPTPGLSAGAAQPQSQPTMAPAPGAPAPQPQMQPQPAPQPGAFPAPAPMAPPAQPAQPGYVQPAPAAPAAPGVAPVPAPGFAPPAATPGAPAPVQPQAAPQVPQPGAEGQPPTSPW